MEKYIIKNPNNKHHNHIVEVRETVLFQGMMKVFCINCNKPIYINPDDLEKVDS